MATRMFNPAHPGEVLREYLGEVTVAEAAEKLRVTRAALSRVLNGHAAVSAEMALRLSEALGTSAEMWAGMQMQRDLWEASQRTRPVIVRLRPRQATAHEVEDATTRLRQAIGGARRPTTHANAAALVKEAVKQASEAYAAIAAGKSAPTKRQARAKKTARRRAAA